MSAHPDLADLDLADLDLAEASRRVQARRVSPVDLTRACLERIERLDDRLNAFITVTAEEALAHARSAEAEIASGRYRGPLHGIPIALKDLIDQAGVRTTGASALFADRIAARDAEVTARLRGAGAVFLGKLNLHELAYGASSVVGHFGAVRNPWDAGRTAGGSSSGAAAAVACGLCYGAVGSDTGGSIRQPAAFCGIVGLKPTYGLVSVRGVIALAPSYDHVGPMTRSVADAALMLGAMADVPDYLTDATADAALDGAERLRVGVARAHFFEALDPEIAAALETALDVVRGLTAELREVAVPAVVDTTLFRAEAWAEHKGRAARTPELFQPETLRRVLAAAELDPAGVAEAGRQLTALRRGAAAHFETIDVLITPTTAIPPFPVADPPAPISDLRALELASLRNTRPFNALGLPTISVPCGFTSSGLPIGMQISAAPGDEASVLRLAHAYERATRGLRRRPELR